MTLWSALLEVELEAATLLEVVKGVVMLMVLNLHILSPVVPPTLLIV